MFKKIIFTCASASLLIFASNANSQWTSANPQGVGLPKIGKQMVGSRAMPKAASNMTQEKFSDTVKKLNDQIVINLKKKREYKNLLINQSRNIVYNAKKLAQSKQKNKDIKNHKGTDEELFDNAKRVCKSSREMKKNYISDIKDLQIMRNLCKFYHLWRAQFIMHRGLESALRTGVGKMYVEYPKFDKK